ncbi:MAG TPA: hypothetical protein VI758_01200 [Bacteroidota bacterium]
MRALVYSLILVALLFGVAAAQFKAKTSEQPNVSESIVRSDDSGLLFGWFDPGKLKMSQSYSLSYQTFGQNGMALGVYTNSLSYQISKPLSVQMDVSLMHSPYNTFGDKFGKSLTGVYLSRAELNYKPSDNTLFQIQFRQLPASLYYGGYGFGSTFWGLDHF